MKLEDTQIETFDEQGYLFFPGLLDEEEVTILQEAIPQVVNRQGPEVIPEKEDPIQDEEVTIPSPLTPPPLPPPGDMPPPPGVPPLPFPPPPQSED